LYGFLEHIETWPPHVPDSFFGGNLRSDPRKPGILPKFAEYFFRVSDQDHKKKPHGKAEGEDG